MPITCKMHGASSSSAAPPSNPTWFSERLLKAADDPNWGENSDEFYSQSEDDNDEDEEWDLDSDNDEDTSVSIRDDDSDDEVDEINVSAAAAAAAALAAAKQASGPAPTAVSPSPAGDSSSSTGVTALMALDRRLGEVFASGDILLVSADFLRSDALQNIVRRQDLALREAQRGEKILLAPKEAQELLLTGKRVVGSLTYGWNSPDHPDPTGCIFRSVQRFLRSPAGAHIQALFWE